MKNIISYLILLTFFALATGCFQGPDTGKKGEPMDEKVRVKNAQVGPGISIDPCLIPPDSTCVIVLVNDSSEYSICFNVHNGDAKTIFLESAHLQIQPPNGTAVPLW